MNLYYPSVFEKNTIYLCDNPLIESARYAGESVIINMLPGHEQEIDFQSSVWKWISNQPLFVNELALDMLRDGYFPEVDLSKLDNYRVVACPSIHHTNNSVKFCSGEYPQ